MRVHPLTHSLIHSLASTRSLPERLRRHHSLHRFEHSTSESGYLVRLGERRDYSDAARRLIIAHGWFRIEGSRASTCSWKALSVSLLRRRRMSFEVLDEEQQRKSNLGHRIVSSKRIVLRRHLISRRVHVGYHIAHRICVRNRDPDFGNLSRTLETFRTNPKTPRVEDCMREGGRRFGRSLTNGRLDASAAAVVVGARHGFR